MSGGDGNDGDIRPGIRRLIRLALRRPSVAPADMDEEIRLHLQLRAEQLRREGLSPEAARREAERRFGDVEAERPRLHASASRREARLRWRERLGDLRHELLVVLRGMRRSPGFVLTAITCIALGVGANAAAYSAFDELLLRPLPVHDPGRLVNLSAPGIKPGSDECNPSGPCDDVFSLPMYRDLERVARNGGSGLASLAAHRMFIAAISRDGDAAHGDGFFVTGSYFPTLGLRPALGRLLGPADDVSPGAHPVAVVSHAYWTAHMGSDPDAVGKTLLVNGHRLSIVGVAPRGFEGTTVGMRAWVYVPMLMMADIDPFFGPRSDYDDRGRYWAYLFGRLEPGATIDQARAALTAAYRPILADVELPLFSQLTPNARPRFLARTVEVRDGRHGQSSLRAMTRTPLLLLLGITALVVLIACANIANLLLVRGASRATEIAVRMSLGASRRRLVLQLLGESCVLAALGGVASLAVAWVTLRAIGSFVPEASLGFGASLHLSLRPSVLAFVGLVSLATGLAFGMYPALHATRSDLIAAIRAGAVQVAGGQRAAVRFRAVLVTAQVALSMALLGCAGLFVRSLSNVASIELGMNPEGVVQFALLPQFTGYTRQRAHALFTRVEDDIAALPGVVAVGASGVPMLTGSSSGGDVRIQGVALDPDANANVRHAAVGPGFFRALDIRLLAGREFVPGDRLGTPRVAIVNEAFARKFGLGRDIVGRRMARNRDASLPLDIEIVGVTRDAAYAGVKDEVPALLYTAYRQDSTVSAAAFYVRGAAGTEPLLRAIPPTVGRLDPALPVPMLMPFAEQVRQAIYLDRMVGVLSAGFAALATLLAAVGLYGVLAYTVAQRTREIGVRMALGADAGRVRRIVLGQVARMVAVGGALGVVAAVGIGRAAQSLLFGLDGRDPLVLAAAAAVLGTVALGAGWVPAWRASRLSPSSALRHD